MQRIVLSSLLLVVVACGPSESASREALEKDGFTDVVLTRDGDHFTFTAKKKGDDCKGTVSATKSSSQMTSFCSSKTEEAKPATCSAETPGICLNDGLAKEKTGDFAAAATLYEKGCNFGDAASCSNLGVAYERGEGVTKDEAKATAFYEKACTAKNGLGCANLGAAHRRAKRFEEARVAWSASCDLGNARGCFGVGLFHGQGLGGKKDPAMAMTFFEKACTAKEPLQDGCGAVGWMNATGEGVPKDIAKGDKQLDDACKAGSGEACKNLGILLRDGKLGARDLPRAYDAFERGCPNDEGACNEAALALERGQGITKDLAKALTLYEKSCDGGSAIGCTNYGISVRDGLGGSPKDPKKAAEAFDKACASGDTKACNLRKGLPP